MALMLNNVQLAGNLTRDPQVRFLANEKAVADFGLAINRKYRGSDGEMKEETTFVDVETWGRQAELVGQYLQKGRNCLVEGSLKLDQWEDRETGAKRSKMKVVAMRVHFIGGERGDRGEGGANGAANNAGNTGNGGANASYNEPRAAAAAPTPVAPSAPSAPIDDEPPF